MVKSTASTRAGGVAAERRIAEVKALDLFCKAGGASMGLHQAGFDVTGVDIEPQPRYPFRFVQGDAFHYLAGALRGFDLIWASPPCQAFTCLNQMWNAKEHADLLTPMRQRLIHAECLYVIENVPGAPLLPGSTKLCGTMFGLKSSSGAELRRHRYFESNFPMLAPPCRHSKGRVIGVYGGHGRDSRRKSNTQDFSTAERREAMDIDWMSGAELSQAIPPAYAKFIGEAAIKYIRDTGQARKWELIGSA